MDTKLVYIRKLAELVLFINGAICDSWSKWRIYLLFWQLWSELDSKQFNLCRLAERMLFILWSISNGGNLHWNNILFNQLWSNMDTEYFYKWNLVGHIDVPKRPLHSCIR